MVSSTSVSSEKPTSMRRAEKEANVRGMPKMDMAPMARMTSERAPVNTAIEGVMVRKMMKTTAVVSRMAKKTTLMAVSRNLPEREADTSLTEGSTGVTAEMMESNRACSERLRSEKASTTAFCNCEVVL